MQECQDQILHHNFVQKLPKILLDNIEQLNIHKVPHGKCFHIPDKDKENHNKEIITDPDKSHLRWRIKKGENFTQVLYANQKKCPKMKDGKTICMKLFLRGICDKSCTREHTNFLLKMKRNLTPSLIIAEKEEQENRIFE